jgi:hypothetical protein
LAIEDACAADPRSAPDFASRATGTQKNLAFRSSNAHGDTTDDIGSAAVG